MPHLTKRFIESIGSLERETVFWDDAMPGFGLRVRKTGHKGFIVQYRNTNNRTRKVTIGPYGRLTPDQARRQAKIYLAQAAQGEDPATDKAKIRKGETISQLVELYLERHARPHKSKRSVKDDISIINQHIKPKLGTHLVKAITRQDVLVLKHKLEGTPIRANRTLALLSKMFSLAEEWGLRPEGTNPCRLVKRFKENKRRRYLSGNELTALGHALSFAEQKDGVSPFVVSAIRMILFSGMRRGEVLGLKWSYVDFENARINLPESKTGAKSIPLNEPALKLLAALPRMANNKYVFCGAKQGKPIVNLNRPWWRIRDKAGIPDVRLHDLRHSYASVGAAAGLGLPVIGALLGHTQAATTQRYAHLADDPLRAATEEVGRRIAEAMEQPVPQKVVPLKRN